MFVFPPPNHRWVSLLVSIYLFKMLYYLGVNLSYGQPMGQSYVYLFFQSFGANNTLDFPWRVHNRKYLYFQNHNFVDRLELVSLLFRVLVS